MSDDPKLYARQDSPSSDEKMDTGSESFASKQDTPNSISSDFDSEPEVLRLQNPELPLLRLTKTMDRNDSLISKMAGLRLDSLDIPDKPKTLPLTPNKSTLTTATDHPLMGLGSPDSVENYPDIVPKKAVKEDLSLSSIEDEKNELNLNNFSYGPQRNTSKNNLYFTEHFTTAENTFLETSDLTSPPDVTKTKQRRKILLKDSSTPQCRADEDDDELSDIQEAPKTLDEGDEFHSGIGDWCAPGETCCSADQLDDDEDKSIYQSSQLCQFPQEPGTPDVVSSSTQEERSLYQATVDAHSGRAALRHRPGAQHERARRKIAVPQLDDTCSLDSVSCLSSDDEDEQLPAPGAVSSPKVEAEADDEDRLNSTSEYSDPIPEYSAAEEFEEERAWLKVPLADGTTSTCDMKVIEPYKRVLSHGGYTAGGCAILVLSACHLPPPSRADYNYVMTHLFLYVLWSVERLVTDHYALVYLGGAAKSSLPTWRWLQQCYTLVDRRLRKNLKHLYLVHPTFWLKSVVMLCRPFISSKFHRKISYVKNLRELRARLPVAAGAVPQRVRDYDAAL